MPHRTPYALLAPHSEGCEFPSEIEQYRGIVEAAVFDRLGRPSFFDELAEVVMGRVSARIQDKHPTERPQACACPSPKLRNSEMSSM